MILAISRFRVANGREEVVREAFFRRPHLVDQAAGFLGMEVFTDVADPAVFHLVTRWTDQPSFQTWHDSDAHRRSHRAIPRGLKLDRAFTQVLLLDRLTDPARLPDLDAVVADAAPFVARYLASMQAVHLLAVDAAGRIAACSAAIAALLKRPADQLLGRPVWGCFPDADAAALRRRVEGGPAAADETFYLNVVDAHDVPFTLACSAQVRPDGFLLLGEAPRKQDEALQEEMVRLNNELALLSRENARKGRALEKALAELKDAQALLVHREKMASLGRMTAGIAHEINNPVAFVLSNLGSLRSDFDDLLGVVRAVEEALPQLAAACPAVHEYLAGRMADAGVDYLAGAVPKLLTANREGLERVAQIAQDLRTFSRLDEDGVKPVDLAENVRADLRFLAPLLAEHGVTVETAFAALPPVPCDPGALNQAISNVVANAVQASRPGQAVRVATRIEGGQCLIEVEDRGAGIAAEHLARVFDPFFTTKPVGQGTGLGLSIAHQVVKAHGGAIDIRSQPGAGTRVQIKIPLAG